MVIADLHEHSPYAKAEQALVRQASMQSEQSSPSEKVWNMPFHQKVCLWHLVKPLFEKGQVFTKEPRYWEFRRQLASAEFKNVVFHRVVDIGRCAKCEYLKWKCSTAPEAFKGIWQEALAKHRMLQIQQKRCYSIDRTLAVASFPRSELYLVTHVARTRH